MLPRLFSYGWRDFANCVQNKIIADSSLFSACFDCRKSAYTIEETLRYIEQLEDDNESLQVALEGNIWSPKKWNENR